MFDRDLIFEKYELSKRKYHNLISENKCCETCGKFLSLEEIDIIYGDDDEVLKEATGKPNGYVIYEGRSHDGNFACIATGLIKESQNVKTGPMVQIFIINADMHPVEAMKQGKNSVQCFDCIHKPATEEERKKGIEGGACYVDVGKSVAQVYKSYKRGCYPNICGDNKPEIGDTESYLKNGFEKIKEIFTGRKIRFGAYGEPVRIPLKMMEMIVNVASAHTGYTHQWKQPLFERYKTYLMASVDTPLEYRLAKNKGWRTFRVSTEWDLHEKEMICMNSWQDKTCAQCLLCCGNSTNVKQDIIIKVHGKLKSKFKPSYEALASMGESGDPTEKYDSADDPNPELTERIMNVSPAQKKQIEKAGEQETRQKKEKSENREFKKFLQRQNPYKSEFHMKNMGNLDKSTVKDINKRAKDVLKSIMNNS
jgi:hypothetical protein